MDENYFSVTKLTLTQPPDFKITAKGTLLYSDLTILFSFSLNVIQYNDFDTPVINLEFFTTI